MRVVRWIGIVLIGWIAIVVAFESMIGIMQPESGDTLVITTIDSDGETSDRVLARLESEGRVFVAANHWPRAWYREALESPVVEVTIEGARGRYRAVPVSEAEHARLQAENPHALTFRILTGFPPREFLRLDPLEGASPPSDET